MVLEALFSTKRILRSPLYMLPLSFVISLASIFISSVIFPQYAGIVFPLLITVTIAPLIYRLFKAEEEIEHAEAENKLHLSFVERHGETIWLFTLFFIGTFLAVFMLVALMDKDFVTSVFSQQISEIEAIRSIGTGAATSGGIMEKIFFNNLRVMTFAFLLSFIIGTGAIFILSWNASILAIFLGNFIRDGLFSDFFLTTAGIMPHAILEIGAYFLAGIAGGILSVGTIREKFLSREFQLVAKDSIILMVLAFALVGVGAYVEVFL